MTIAVPAPGRFLQLLSDYASPTPLSGSGIARRLCLRQRWEVGDGTEGVVAVTIQA